MKTLSVSVIALLMAGSAVLANDIVIMGGRVIDPETGLDAIRNVAIDDGKIVAISEFALDGDTVVDAAGHVVSPGFIDIHAHGTSLPAMRMQVMQGVTTVLELESGVLPISDWYEMLGAQQTPINYGASAAWTFSRIAAFTDTDPLADPSYFQDAQKLDPWRFDIATQQQFDRIMELVEEGLKEGALGIGINSGYAPGYGQMEYFALAELAKKYNVATYTHTRYISNTEPNSSFEAIKELIGNAAITGAHMHLCHVNSGSLRLAPKVLDMFDKAQSQGIPVTIEAYPYGAGNGVVGAAIFTTPDDWRERIDSDASSFQLGADRLTEEQFADLQANDPGTFVTWHYLEEDIPEDLAIIDASITHPSVLIASDSVFWSYFDDDGSVKFYEGDEWPLPEKVFSHPRSAGTYAKILRSYVRERGLLSMNEAIRKMSLMPAQTLEEFVPQMRKKGRIQVGMDADIVVFDPATVADKATYENANQPAVGFQTVLVDGGFVVQNGELVLDADGGVPIRRPVE
jgi:N-acyl-D-aspartate/D-glutamate deacylase